MCKSHANGSVECFFSLFLRFLYFQIQNQGRRGCYHMLRTFFILALKDFQLREPGTDRNANMHRAAKDTSLSTPYLVSFEDCRERR